MSNTYGQKNIREIIGQRIKSSRETLDWTITRCAKELEITQSYLTQIEQGTKSPSLEVLQKVRTKLNVDLNEIISGSLEHVVKDQILDYQHSKVKRMEKAIDGIEKLSDEIKSIIKETKKRWWFTNMHTYYARHYAYAQ